MGRIKTGFATDTIVRLKRDPGQFGQVTGKPPRMAAGKRVIQEVNFMEMPSFPHRSDQAILCAE